jgi:hypothetical protein
VEVLALRAGEVREDGDAGKGWAEGLGEKVLEVRTPRWRSDEVSGDWETRRWRECLKRVHGCWHTPPDVSIIATTPSTVGIHPFVSTGRGRC